MTNKNSVRIRKTVITALCVALCIVLPMAFHMVKNAGTGGTVSGVGKALKKHNPAVRIVAVCSAPCSRRF
mgnify:CR=1 FL=1